MITDANYNNMGVRIKFMAQSINEAALYDNKRKLALYYTYMTCRCGGPA